MKIIAPEASRNTLPIRLPMCWMAPDGSSRLSEKIASRLDQISQAATTPSKPTLASDLTSSTRPWVENMRLMPDSGFRRLKSGMKALVLNSQPRSSSGEARTAITTRARKGASASAAARNWSDSCVMT